MYTDVRFVKPPQELIIGKRPTMVVEIEEPPTLTISSDEIIAYVERMIISLVRGIKRISIYVGKQLVRVYKKLSSLSIHVSFEEEQEVAPSVVHKPVSKKIAPGQLDLFYTPQELDMPISQTSEPIIQTVTIEKQKSHTSPSFLPFITLGAVLFGLVTRMVLLP